MELRKMRWKNEDELEFLLNTEFYEINKMFYDKSSDLDYQTKLSKKEFHTFCWNAYRFFEIKYYKGHIAEGLLIANDLEIFFTKHYKTEIRKMNSNDTLAGCVWPQRTRMDAGGRYRMAISYKLYEKYGWSYTLNTIKHEMAHIATGIEDHTENFWKEGKRTGFGETENCATGFENWLKK